MSKDKYDPFEGVRRISDLWEKQLNGLLYMMTDNNEFVRLLKVGTDSHSRYMEQLKKNQELMSGLLNMPTKSDVANVAKVSIQTEGKIDVLEEHIWHLQDSLDTLNKDNLAMFQEIQRDFQDLRQEVTQLTDIKLELAALKNLIEKGKKKDIEKELVLTGPGLGTSK